MDIATTAWGTLALIDKLIQHITTAIGGNPTLTAFQKQVEPLRAILTNIAYIFDAKSSENLNEDLRSQILSVLGLCESALKEIEAGLPRKTIGFGRVFINQINDHFKSNDTQTQMQNLDRCMRALNISLMVVSLVDSQQLQDAQIQILNKTDQIYTYLAIQDERDELLSNLPSNNKQWKALSRSMRLNSTVSNEEVSRIMKDWGDTISECISSYQPSEDEKESYQESFTQDIRSKFLSFWKKVGFNQSKPFTPSADQNPLPHSFKVPTTSNWSKNMINPPNNESNIPMPSLKNITGHHALNLDDLNKIIEEYQRVIESSRDAAIDNSRWYDETAIHQRDLINLLEQRLEFYGKDFDKQTEVEKLVDILIEQSSTEGLCEAATILDNLLDEKDIEPLRRARLKHHLAFILFRQKWQGAEWLANEALNDLIDNCGSDKHITETRRLLIEIWEASGKTPAANVFKDMLSNASIQLQGSTSLDSADHDVRQSAINARNWIDRKGFLVMVDSSAPEEREMSFGTPFDAVHPEQSVTPMQMAAREMDIDALDALIRAGASIELADQKGVTPLLFAASTKSFRTVQFLINKGASLAAEDQAGDTALHRVQDARGGTQAARAILEASNGEQINKDNNMGMRALHLAAWHGNVDMANLLLEFKANINLQNKITLTTPLHLAIEAGQVNMVNLLLEKDADATEVVNAYGQSAVEAGRKSTDPIRAIFHAKFGRR